MIILWEIESPAAACGIALKFSSLEDRKNELLSYTTIITKNAFVWNQYKLR